jgi:hypothetical protein
VYKSTPRKYGNMNKNKLTPIDILNKDDFLGIILPKKLLKRLDVEGHPFLKILIENEIASKGHKVSEKMVGCVVHEDGWGFATFLDREV